MLLHGHFPGEPRVEAEVRTAVDAGFEVDLIAMRGPGEEALTIDDGVRCFRLPLEHARGGGIGRVVAEYLGFTLLAGVKAAQVSGRRYSVVQVHNPPDFLVLAALLPRLRGARVLLDVHDLSSDMFMMRFGDRRGARFADRLLRLVERAAAVSSDHVVTVHEPYRDELVERGVPGAMVSVVMNSLDERLMPASQAENDRGFSVVYHGTITPHYGVGLLVEAASRLRDTIPGLRVDIIGHGDAVPELTARAQSLGLDGVLRITGRSLPQAEVLEFVSGASVGVVPNLPTRLNQFALSTKLLEYVALGVPVVSADLPTIRHHFSDAEMLFFRAGDADALADALAQVAADPDAAAARARAARARYEAYRWDRSAATYRAVLSQLTRAGRSRDGRK